MRTFDSLRRDLLRTGSLGLAGAALPAASFAASRKKGNAPKGEGIFSVRDYGATGDGKTLDTDAVNRTIAAAAAAGGGVVVFPAGTYCAFPST